MLVGRVWARRRPAGAVVAVVALAVVALVARDPGGSHQSQDEIDELGKLPDGVTPLDAAHPNPTGDDPLAIGTPPEFEPASSAEEFLTRAEQRRDTAAAATPALKATGLDAPPPEPEPVPGALLVSFEPGTAPETIAAALDGAGVEGAVVEGLAVAEVDTGGQDQAVVVTALQNADGVVAVEPNLVRRAAVDPSDPELAAQAPYLDAVGARQAWDVADTAGSHVVAVLDTGVDLDHPDLAPNLVAGFDAIANDNTPIDDNGHGTAVAGILGAVTDNGTGMAGVAWNTRVMPVKVLDAEGFGTDADIAQGIVWATDHGARVINMSLGGPGTSYAIDSAVRHALDNEVVVVAAAGNAGAQGLFYPAGAPGVLGVTATDSAGQFAWFSNHGPWYMLAAPGIDIRTTALTPGTAGSYTTGTGTSFSSPIVAGVAALLAERHPGWGWFEIADQMLLTARDAGPAGLDDSYGYGIVDAAAALGVRPVGATTQVDRAGDAGDTQGTARLIPVGGPAPETLGYEYDEDWFAFDVPAAAGATVTVTPPAPLPAPGVRAAEMDPVIELYGPGGGVLARVDSTFHGEAETLTVDLDPGRHTLRVTSYAGSAGPGPYQVEVSLGEPLLPTAWAPREDVFDVVASKTATAVADFDGDGRDDLAMTTGTGATAPADEYQLFVFTQGPDGTLGAPAKFATHSTYPGFYDPLRAADLDGDGDVDLAHGTPSGLDVAWNDGTGLTAPVLYPEAGSVRWIHTAEMDGTAPVDLVVATGAGSLQALTWAGDQFTVTPLGIDTTVELEGVNFDVADLTGDGLPDVVTFADTGLALHAAQADGTWAAPAPISLPGFDPTFSRTVTTGDVTGDGRADVVVTARVGNTAAFGYYVQQADGTLGTLVSLPRAGFTVGSAKIADVDDDGRDDVVVLYAGAEVGVFPQTATGALGDEVLLDGGFGNSYRSADAMAIGDVDGDGIADVTTAGYNGLSLFTHQPAVVTEGAGPWLSASSPADHATGVATSAKPTVTFGRDVAASSVRADTVALVNGRSGSAVGATVSLSGRKVTLTPSAPLQPGTPYQVWVAGVTDPTGAESAYERVMFTTAAGAAPVYDVTATLIPFQADLDANGYDDIFWYGPEAAADSIWFHDANGRTTLAFDVWGTYTPVAGDYDGNGYDDMFWYGPGSGSDVMWWNGRDGLVAESVPVSGTYVPVAGDFDRNGYDDIFWYGPGSGADSVWYFGPNGRTTVAQSIGGSYRPAAGDFTRDGYDDVVWYGPGTGAEELWRGSAAGFVKGPIMAVTGSYQVQTMDYDADGFDELYLYESPVGMFWRSGASGFRTMQIGPMAPAGVRPVTGDFTGDGRDDLLTYIPGGAADPLHLGGPDITGLAALSPTRN